MEMFYCMKILVIQLILWVINFQNFIYIFVLFQGILTTHKLFNAEIWFIS